MIDTDKYKGHDTGWKAHFFEDGSIAVGGVCNLLTEETGYVTRKMIEANALLIQDAPLLLAEVKRLNMVINMLRKNDLWVSTEGWEESDKDDELIVSMNYLIQASLELRGDLND